MTHFVLNYPVHNIIPLKTMTHDYNNYLSSLLHLNIDKSIKINLDLA